MSYFIFEISWEGGAPLPEEWTLHGVLDPEDIAGHLTDIFQCPVDCFEYIEL